MDLIFSDNIMTCLFLLLAFICSNLPFSLTHSHGSNTGNYNAGRNNNPQQQGAHVHHMQERPTSFHDSKVVHDSEHIKEHLDGVADIGQKDLTPEELEFHYFKLHDFDNNSLLDGLEIYKALTHLLSYETIEQEDGVKIDTTGKSQEQIKNEKNAAEQLYYTTVVDNVLADDDVDNDGYLSYLEYIMARRREEKQQQRSRQNKM